MPPAARSVRTSNPLMIPELGPPIEVLYPECGLAPVVVSSPHSGRIYPPSLLDQVDITMAELRRLEDGCVDRLFESAPGLGAPLLRARFARAYVDPNRDAYELDPELFWPPLPDHAKVGSIRARAGLGTVPSRIGGQRIYRGRLAFAEAERRIALAYAPYHRALQRLLAQPHAEFGVVLLLDCHSMPSLTANGGRHGERPVDIALGDRYGRSCAPQLVERAEACLRRAGLRVGRNRPYAGGQITARYGRPDLGTHALQIEVRRDLYMDERSHEPLPGFNTVASVLRGLLVELALETRAVPPLHQALPVCQTAS
jgi:N-formylglutamate amidohydrolase